MKAVLLFVIFLYSSATNAITYYYFDKIYCSNPTNCGSHILNPGDRITLRAIKVRIDVSTGDEIVSYPDVLWRINGDTINSQPQNIFLLMDTGFVDYYFGNLLSSPEHFVESMTEIDENNFSKSINIFPNPFKDQLSIEIDKGKLPYSCVIYDCIGRIIYTQIFQNLVDKKITLGCGFLSEGVYILGIKTKETEFYKQILKQ
jgi:hypothetical protein